MRRKRGGGVLVAGWRGRWYSLTKVDKSAIIDWGQVRAGDR